jgi:hypothetical protein
MTKTQAKEIAEQYFRYGLITKGERTVLLDEISRASEIKSLSYEKQNNVGLWVDDKLINLQNGKVKIQTVC